MSSKTYVLQIAPAAKCKRVLKRDRLGRKCKALGFVFSIQYNQSNLISEWCDTSDEAWDQAANNLRTQDTIEKWENI